MSEIRDALVAMGLPAGDLHALPDSPLRFADGAHYRIEIPSTEGPDCLRAVLDAAARLDVRVHRVSQGSGVFMLTDAELDDMASVAREARVEVSLFARPNAGWDASATAAAPAGAMLAAASRGPGAGRPGPRRHRAGGRARHPQRADRRPRAARGLPAPAIERRAAGRHAGEALGAVPGHQPRHGARARRPRARTR